MTGQTAGNSLRIAIVAAVNNDDTLANNLARSELIRSGTASLHCYRGFASAGAAYNRGIDETTSDYIIFAHQDVYLPEGWLQAFQLILDQLARTDPDWAVLGSFGIATDGARVGHVWSSGVGRLLGGPFEKPVEAVCMDEMLLVLRRPSGLRFDEDLSGFHLYGTDIVLSAQNSGLRSYVVDLPAIHNSRSVRKLGSDYARAYGYMQRKWAADLPLDTLIMPVTKGPWTMCRARLRLQYVRLRRHFRRGAPVDSATSPKFIASQLGFERSVREPYPDEHGSPFAQNRK